MLLIVKIGEYLVFCVYHRFYLLWSSVIVVVVVILLTLTHAQNIESVVTRRASKRPERDSTSEKKVMSNPPPKILFHEDTTVLQYPFRLKRGLQQYSLLSIVVCYFIVGLTHPCFRSIVEPLTLYRETEPAGACDTTLSLSVVPPPPCTVKQRRRVQQYRPRPKKPGYWSRPDFVFEK